MLRLGGGGYGGLYTLCSGIDLQLQYNYSTAYTILPDQFSVVLSRPLFSSHIKTSVTRQIKVQSVLLNH